MSKEHDAERLFSENVDRLLAGDEPKNDPEADKDLREATDFAQKMVELRPTPSSDFEARLKAKLLQKLSEEEAEARSQEKSGWFWRLVPRQPVWQVAYALLLMVMVGGVMWGTGVFRHTATQAPASGPSVLKQATTQPAPSGANVILRVDASTDKPSYRPGQEVRIEVELKNVTSQPISIEQFPPILSLMQSESKQPVYTFAAGKGVRTLAPDEAADFVLVWDQRDDRGRYVPAGGYYLELEDVDYQGRAMQLNLTAPVHFDIVLAASSGGIIRKIFS